MDAPSVPGYSSAPPSPPARDQVGMSVPDVQAITGCSWDTLSRHYIKADMRWAHAVVSDIFS